MNSNKIQSVIKKIPNKQKFWNRWFHKFYQIIKELTPIFLKLFQKIKQEATLPNSFYNAIITLITKTRQRHCKKRKLWANIPDERRSKLNSTIHWKDHTPWCNGIYCRMQGWFSIHKLINMIHHINKSKDKIHHLNRCRKST